MALWSGVFTGSDFCLVGGHSGVLGFLTALTGDIPGFVLVPVIRKPKITKSRFRGFA